MYFVYVKFIGYNQTKKNNPYVKHYAQIFKALFMPSLHDVLC